MLAPGMTVNASGRISVTMGAGTVPAFFNEGWGFMANGSLALDTDAPTGDVWQRGFRKSPAGALYANTVTAGSDVYIDGLRVSTGGRLRVEAANGASYVNGTPLTAAGLVAVT